MPSPWILWSCINYLQLKLKKNLHSITKLCFYQTKVAHRMISCAGVVAAAFLISKTHHVRKNVPPWPKKKKKRNKKETHISLNFVTCNMKESSCAIARWNPESRWLVTVATLSITNYPESRWLVTVATLWITNYPESRWLVTVATLSITNYPESRWLVTVATLWITNYPESRWLVTVATLSITNYPESRWLVTVATLSITNYPESRWLVTVATLSITNYPESRWLVTVATLSITNYPESRWLVTVATLSITNYPESRWLVTVTTLSITSSSRNQPVKSSISRDTHFMHVEVACFFLSRVVVGPSIQHCTLRVGSDCDQYQRSSDHVLLSNTYHNPSNGGDRIWSHGVHSQET